MQELLFLCINLDSKQSVKRKKASCIGGCLGCKHSSWCHNRHTQDHQIIPPIVGRIHIMETWPQNSHQLPLGRQERDGIGEKFQINFNYSGCFHYFNNKTGLPLPKKRKVILDFPGVQWLRIHLPMQGTWVRSQVWEDSTCFRATKPMLHNYWASTPGPTCHNYWAHKPQPCLHTVDLCSAAGEAATLRSPYTSARE